MQELKIGIVEDELLIAENIATTLHELGYLPMPPVSNYDEALQMIERDSPDLLVVDIALEGELDGIDLARTINEKYNLPFIFLSANSDRATVDRAKEVKPYAYLIKPFSENDLFTSIEIAFSNFNQRQAGKNSGRVLRDSIFIKEGDLFHRVVLRDILYAESEDNYVNLHTPKRKYTLRSKLEEFINQYASDDFVRIHRRYAINLHHLKTINALSVIVADKSVPLQKSYKEQLMECIRSAK